MRQRTDYKICKHCGANIDIGEVCDCMRHDLNAEAPRRALKAKQGTNYQLEIINALKRQIWAYESTHNTAHSNVHIDICV